MPKIFYLALIAGLLCSNNLRAQENQENNEEIRIPMAYLSIDQKCINNDINLYNICLKDSFLNILKENFTEEQQKELMQSVNEIEKQIAEAEPDYDDPKNADLKDNPSKIKEYNAHNMNLIWKKLLVDTLNNLENAE